MSCDIMFFSTFIKNEKIEIHNLSATYLIECLFIFSMSCNFCSQSITNTYVVMESLKMHIGCYEEMSKCVICERKCFNYEINECLICGSIETNINKSDENISRHYCDKCSNSLIEYEEWIEDEWENKYPITVHHCKKCKKRKYPRT